MKGSIRRLIRFYPLVNKFSVLTKNFSMRYFHSEDLTTFNDLENFFGKQSCFLQKSLLT